MSLKVARGDIIGFNYELTPEQVMSPCAKAMYHRSHLLLLDRIQPLGVVELPTFKGNGMTLLH